MLDPPLDNRQVGVFFKGNRNHWSNCMTANRKAQKTATDTPVVKVVRASRRNRRAAREEPQAFPEITNRELLRDLENDELGEEDELI